MSFVLKITEFLVSTLAGLGTTKDALELKAQELLDDAGGDVKVAGEKWLAWFLEQYEAKIGDFESAKAFGQQLWESATAHRPAYNRHHFFNL